MPNFNNWDELARKDSLPQLKHHIDTSDKFTPSPHLPLLGDFEDSLCVLDFGCGLGRNIAGMPRNWQVFGYDSPAMLARLPEHLDLEVFANVILTTDLEELVGEGQHFNAVLASLVFQHMRADELRHMLALLAPACDRLVLESRSYKDFDKLPVRDFLSNSGLWNELRYQDITDTHAAEHPEAHFVAVYEPSGPLPAA